MRKHKQASPSRKLTLAEAAASGIVRVRLRTWLEGEHLELDIKDGEVDSVNFVSPFGRSVIIPFRCLWAKMPARSWMPYEGPARSSKEWKSMHTKLSSHG